MLRLLRAGDLTYGTVSLTGSNGRVSDGRTTELVLPLMAKCTHAALRQKATARRRRKAEKVRLAKHLADFKKTPGYPLTEDLCISLTYGFWKNYIAPWDHRSAFRLS